MSKILWLLVLLATLYWIYRLLTIPHPAWKYLSDPEKAKLKKWFIYPRLWK